jgi:tetratricopeptide (TPR) repeat protein/tRNA A-37 threonylcarbamoyl transferase component Bud32
MPLKCPTCDTVNPDTQKYCGECGTSLPASGSHPADRTQTIESPLPESIRPGSVFAGKFRLIREIGRGAMGVVYEAEDTKLKRTVALKFLPRERLHDARARERFVHEARAASALDHPNICTVYEIDESESGQMYIAMACYRGESLKDKIEGGRLGVANILSLAAQVADGLATAHEHGIVHRDVKPANILVADDGRAKIVDFGLAKLTGDVRLTRPGTLLGTVAYMSPEQVNGENVDARTDVWSLGVIIYEMLTGRLPFEGETETSFAYAIVHKNIRPLENLPRGTPRDLVEVIERALAKDPAKRFPSGREMAAALNVLQKGAATRRSGWRMVSRHPAVTRFGLALALLAIILFVVPDVRLKMGSFLGFGPPRGNLHIAVLPLNAIGGGDEDQVLSDGLTEFLSRQLGELAARLKATWVSPVDQARAYDVKEASDADRVLGASIVLTGTMKRTGNVLNVVLEAVDPRRLQRFTTLSKTDSVANVATWQEDLALETAALLGIPPSPADRPALAAGGTTVPGALEAHLRGLGFMANTGFANVDRAVQALEEAVKLDPSFASGEADLAAALRWKFSLTGEESLLARAESGCRQALLINERLGRAHLVLGRICRGLRRYEEAVREFQAAGATGPWGYDAATEIAATYEENLQPARAETAYREAIRLRPGYWAAYSYLGFFYFYQGQTEKARDMYLRVTKIVPNNINGLNSLGAAYFKLGDYVRAEELFARSNAVKRNPDACSNLGTIYYYRGRYADAVGMYEAAVGYNKDYYVLWGNLADAYHFTFGNEAKAADAYAKAVTLAERDLAVERGDAQVRSRLAVYLVKTGSLEKAASEITEALRHKPDDPTVVLKSILVFELAGDRARALEALKRYLELKGPLEEVSKDPFFAGLRRDPEYLRIVGRGG